MPYTNVPESLWSKMDRCVEAVQTQGRDKETAISICYASVVGEKQREIALGVLVTTDSLNIGDPVAIIDLKCKADGCSNQAQWNVDVSGENLYYCAQHLGGAVKTLDRHGLRFKARHAPLYGVQIGEHVYPLHIALHDQDKE